MIDLTAKLGEINDIEHKRGSKIYPQNQVVFFLLLFLIGKNRHGIGEKVAIFDWECG